MKNRSLTFLIAVTSLVLVSLACFQVGGSDPQDYEPSQYATPEEFLFADTEEEFFKVFSIGAAYNGASAPTKFTIAEGWQVTEILTYHWNQGQGMTPGTIGLQASDGTIYGPWQAAGQDGQGGVPNASWVVYPNIMIPAGIYTVLDSDPSTWSQNDETGGAGMAWGRGFRQDAP